MTAVSSLCKLPRPVLQEVDQRLVEHNFSDYRAICEWLETLGHPVSLSALGRYAIRLKKKLAGGPEFNLYRSHAERLHLEHLRQSPRVKLQWLYIAGLSGTNKIALGLSGNIYYDLAQHQLSHVELVELLVMLPGTAELKQKLLNWLAPVQRAGAWYDLPQEQRKSLNQPETLLTLLTI